MLAPPETAGRGEELLDTKNRCHSVDTKLLHPQFNSSGPMVAAKRQISWGCVATSNDDLSAITATTGSNGLSPPTNSSLPLIVSTTEYIFLLEMKQRVSVSQGGTPTHGIKKIIWNGHGYRQSH
jgi:hypothetical protein